MRRREIPNTPVYLTELGFGASVIGNLYRETSPQDAAAAITARAEGMIRADTPIHDSTP